MAKIIIIKGEDKGKSFSLDEQETTVGRSPEADIKINDLRASRKHAQFVKAEDGFYLEDMKSQNGTFLNGNKISERVKLSDRDNVCIGTTWFNFVEEEETAKEGANFFGYLIHKKMAEDETGILYRATQESLKREVILWVLPFSSLFKDEMELERCKQSFVAHISSIANLFNRNLAMLLDFGATEKYFYCSFEEVDLERNVHDCMKNGPLDASKTLEIGIEIAKGMKYIHDNGILHLHLTSRNVLFQKEENDRVLITELGVSRFLSESSQGKIAKATGLLGIFDYIAPEQITGAFPVSFQSDVYSYGCLLYNLLSGTPPFQSKSPYQMAESHLKEMPPSLKEKRKDVPERLCALVHRCMEKNPADRFPSFLGILDELEKIKKEFELQEMLKTEEGKELLSQTVGEKTEKRWWILGPLFSLALGIVFFFLAPAIAEWFPFFK